LTLVEKLQGDDTITDGGSGGSTESDSATKFSEDGNADGLPELQRAGTNRGGKRVGDIVGTCCDSEARCFFVNEKKKKKK
jgi:hypothetical protein